MDRFVSLHRHSSYSIYDGVDLPVRAADYCVRLEQPALALTDHGTVYGVIDHFRWCLDRRVKPIVGCEVYVVDALDKESPRRHLTLLVENRRGYENLMRLVTLGYRQMYYKPRVTYEDLEGHAEGLIVLSGCPSGHIAKAIEAGDLALAEDYFCRLLDVFDDRFYAEIQHGPAARLIAPYVVDMASRHGVRLVFTNDAHYVEARDRQAHDLLLRLRSSKGETNPTYGSGYHMMSRSEARDTISQNHAWLLTSQVEAALDATIEIADRIDFSFERPERMLPPVFGSDPMGDLRRVVSAAQARRGVLTRGYSERLDEELRVVERLGYAEYFLLVSDITTWARERDILVGPRGSVCGSLLAYVTGITMIDPLLHGTMFERFLHDEKKSFPDIDLDIDSRRRDEIHDYVLKKYDGNAFQIVTFGRWGAASVSNDLAKAVGLDDLTKREMRAALDQVKFDRILIATEEDLSRHEVFRRLEPLHPGITRVASRLYSMVQYHGRHPGGICFVPGTPEKWVALGRVGDDVVTTGNFQDVEWCGLLKCDLLGLSAMSSLADARDMVEARHGEKIDLSSVPLDDPDVLRRFATGDTDGVFQFETRGARDILREIEPDSFAEVAAATALNRPGVMGNLSAYVAGKAGRHDSDQLSGD